MGTLRLKLKYIERMRWPSKCAYCGAEANAEAKTSFTTFSSLRYYITSFEWKEQRYTVSYPVCRQHKKFFYTRMPSAGFALSSFVFLVIPIGGIWLLYSFLGDSLVLTGDTLIYVAAPLIVLSGLISSLLFYFFLLKPIRISIINRSTLKLHIRDDGCYDDFNLLNRDIIAQPPRRESKQKEIVPCKTCGQNLRIPIRPSALRVSCPKCGSIFVIDKRKT
jgi:predicted RNA-binding Zn-ribbon protein involved in translation (DUF1610 family)